MCSESKVWICCCFAGEPAGRAAAGAPRGYWSFSWVAEDDLRVPNNSASVSGESDDVSPHQADGQAQPAPSSKDLLLTIGRDTWHQLSINTHKRLCLA